MPVTRFKYQLIDRARDKLIYECFRNTFPFEPCDHDRPLSCNLNRGSVTTSARRRLKRPRMNELYRASYDF